MEQSKQIIAELISGPRCGDTGDHHAGVSELRFDSTCNHGVIHRYALDAIVGGVARYVYDGVISAE